MPTNDIVTLTDATTGDNEEFVIYATFPVSDPNGQQYAALIRRDEYDEESDSVGFLIFRWKLVDGKDDITMVESEEEAEAAFTALDLLTNGELGLNDV